MQLELLELQRFWKMSGWRGVRDAARNPRSRWMAVVLYAVLAITLSILVVLATIICTADSSLSSSATKQKEKLDPPVVDLPDIVAPRRRHVAERGLGAAL